MSEPMTWAQAHAIQAAADLATFESLQMVGGIPECHRLMLLQMACEKLTKAQLCAGGSAAADLQKSHGYVAKNLHIVIRTQIGLSQWRVRNPKWVVAHTKLLASEIELLTPAVRRGGRRLDNCEYPWEDEQQRLHVPIRWNFTPSQLIVEPAGRTFLKLLHDAIQRLM